MVHDLSTAFALAADAVAGAVNDPRAAAALATRALAEAGRDPVVVSLAERALGIARREQGDVDAALRHLRRSAGAARRARRADLAALADTSRALTLGLAGRPRAAVDVLDSALPLLRGRDRAEAEAQRALLLAQRGQLVESLAGHGRALAAFRRAGDVESEAKLRNNRAALRVYLGDLKGALADYDAARAAFEAAGRPVQAAWAVHNSGWALSCAGDVPLALQRLDEAEGLLAGTDAFVHLVGLTRAEALLRAGVSEEAEAVAAAVASGITGVRGYEADRAEAELLAAKAALMDGNLVAAARRAAGAARVFTRHGRSASAAVARSVEHAARHRAGQRIDPADVAANAAVLDDAGLTVEGADAHVLCGLLALRDGDLGTARKELEVARRRRNGGPELGAKAWHAEAVLRLAAGNRAGALRAARRGLSVVDRQRAVFGSTELRARWSRTGQDLAQLGLRLAVESGRAGAALEWVERWRAQALDMPPARPVDDAALAADLLALRAAVADDQADPTVRTRVGRLERRVRDRMRAAAARGPAAGRESRGTAVIPERMMVLFELDGALWRIDRGAGRRLRLDRLDAAPSEVADEAGRLRFALRRLAMVPSGPGSSAAAAAATAAARALDRQLLDGVDVGPAMVVVPTAPLHALPWPALPSLAGTALSVAPSLHFWQRATGAGRSRGGAVFVAGPDLPHAGPEVRAVARRNGSGTTTLTGKRATVDAVLEALDGAALAHVAAHGTFRDDNPLFSALHLHDGPLFVHDLERLRRAPSTVVLSACDSGLSASEPGDEMMGLAAALFALGTRALVASVLPVPDAATRALMAGFHRHLAGGSTPATALAAAAGEMDADGEGAAVARAAFICFGAG